MLYIKEVKYNFEDYLEELRLSVTALITAMDELDHVFDAPTSQSAAINLNTLMNTASEENLPAAVPTSSASLPNGVRVPPPNKTGPIGNRLKSHLLMHVVDSIKRFGSLLWCETEKNEQFNASIRGALIKSN